MTLADFLESEIETGSFPGGAALVGSGEAVVESAAAGNATVLPQAAALSGETLFDLASLTKPLATGALFAQARLDLGSPPGRFFPEWKATRYDGITLEHLLTHTSGLPAWYPLYARGEGALAYRRTLATIEPVEPPGSRVIYSDLNFRTAATERGDATERRMTEELGLSYPHFRAGVVRGEVHDGNAFRRGGVAGNAGLFGTARDVWALARTWLEAGRDGLAEDRTPHLPEARGLSWQGKRGSGSAVAEMSDHAFGHTGFTGTSVWIEPERDRIAVLLTNRVHPEVKPGNFHEVRRRFQAVVCRGGWSRCGS